MSRKIWKYCNNSRWTVEWIKILYANWSNYLAEEWHILYVFIGNLTSSEITNVTDIIQTCNSHSTSSISAVTSSWLTALSLWCGIVQIYRLVIPKISPYSLTIIIVFTNCTKYVDGAVFIISVVNSPMMLKSAFSQFCSLMYAVVPLKYDILRKIKYNISGISENTHTLSPKLKLIHIGLNELGFFNSMN